MQTSKRAVLLAVALVCAILLWAAFQGKAHGAETAHWTSFGRMEKAVLIDVRRFLGVLQDHLTQEEINAVEADMFPTPSAEEMKSKLELIKEELGNFGLKGDDALVQAVDAKILAVEAEAVPAEGK